jgi:hypothetical protein
MVPGPTIKTGNSLTLCSSTPNRQYGLPGLVVELRRNRVAAEPAPMATAIMLASAIGFSRAELERSEELVCEAPNDEGSPYAWTFTSD